jgi:hypothetical protein
MGVEPSGPGTGVGDAALKDCVSQPRPNPFNPETTIDFSVAAGGRVTVRIYDAAGRLVRTLFDREVPAGSSGRVAWDGLDDRGAACASGVYLCRVRTESFEASRKLVLLK